MSRKVSLPKIDPRKATDLLRQLRRMAPHYTKEWAAKDDVDPGVALLKIFSFLAEGVISRLNRAPERNFLAFLDMLGIRLLPASPARVPVRFLLANGTENAFKVPRATQVSAAANAQRLTELPFETMVDLWAIPAKLTELIAVDPAKDQIYKPPPAFLELEQAARDLPLFLVTAFSSAGSKFLQLDPPDQVAANDFLRIDQPPASGSGVIDTCLSAAGTAGLGTSDHLVVADVKGTIVTVADPLPRDYVEGTPVRKVTDFELFEAKNWQEHVLYLGHAEYFAIKSAAQIELLVEHAGAVANLDSLDVIWEFYGVTEILKEAGWHRFEVDLDGTLGFSRNGRIVLNKPAGEIQEKEINGNKSRWIRARLNEPLPATPPPPLPTIESIYFRVSSGGQDLVADQAFSNDTPLTTDVPFFPFGTEPRIFDRFSIASEEAFSKPGAEIDLSFKLDTTDLLASPAAVAAKNIVRVFATGAAGKLLEFQIDPVTSDLVVNNKHGSPKDTRLTAGSVPAVVTDPTEAQIAVFAKADDGKIYLRSISTATGDSQDWKALGVTPGALQFDPVAIELQLPEFDSGTHLWQMVEKWVVIAVADNKLYYQTIVVADSNRVSGWNATLDGPRVDSTPFIVMDPGVFTVVTDIKGLTWIHELFGTWKMVTPNVSAEVPTPDPTYVAAANARPFARIYRDDSDALHVRVYLRNQSNELVALDTDPAQNRNLGAPAGGVGSNPFGTSLSGDKRVYIRGTELSHLWSIDDSPGGQWVDHETTDAINLDGDPFVLAYTSQSAQFISAFSTSKKNALLEFRISRANLGAGNLQAGPNDIILLQPDPPSEVSYIHITIGPGAGSSGEAVRKFNDALSREDFVVLESPLDESPTTDTKYELFREEDDGDVQSATATTITLKVGGGDEVDDGDYVYAAGQLRRIPEAPDEDEDEVEIEPPWDAIPTSTDTYVLLRLDEQTQGDHAAGFSARRAVLDPSVNEPEETYQNKFLRITAGPGQSSVSRRIDEYFPSTNNVALASDFDVAPTSDSSYAITVSNISEAWYVHKDPDQVRLRPELSWEYFNGRGWVGLAVDDGTGKLLTEGNVRFRIPEDMAKTEVAGQENFWIRARIVGGDYGREEFTFDQETGKLTVEKDPIRPPLINKLALKYKLTEEQPPQVCLTFNNLNYLDQSAANVTEDKHFKPYLTLEDSGKAVYFGFDQSFEGGPVRLYFAANELVVDDRNKPKLTWEFGSDNTWKPLTADDGTDAFTKPDFVSLIMPDGLQNSQEFGKTLYWLRATLTEGSWSKSPLFKGVFLNTVAALQARTIRDEILGSSTSEKNQKFRFQQVPVLEGEEVRVLEVLTDIEREELVSALGQDAVRNIADQRGQVLQTWIRWTEVIEFFDSQPGSRHYRLDRATGEIEFGDGVRGRIPPPGGDNIQAFAYQTGGGASGNVAPGEITSAVTAVAGVDSVLNPVAGGGGSEAATNDEMLEIGPAQISHRERAVTPEDFERLAREASREVRKALCLPNRNAGGRHELGWTSVHIVPDSKKAEPQPSLELRRAVERYLAERADVTLVDQDHIFVGPPKYVPVNVEVTVFARSLDVVATAEQNVKQKLEQFLHPLTGGPDNEGWEFGRGLAASDLYALLEDIEDVDHVDTLRLVFGDEESLEQVKVDADALLASGTPKIDMRVAGENR